MGYLELEDGNYKTGDGGAILFHNKEGLLHREHGLPTIVNADGTKMWHQNGKLHRDGDLPAILYNNGSKFWYRHGKEYVPDILQSPAVRFHNDPPIRKRSEEVKFWKTMKVYIID